jgi:hypothetical protein
MGRLNQVIAVVAGKKAKAAQVITDAYHKIQKGPLFDGISKTYQPKDEEGDRLPPEAKAIQVKVQELVTETEAALTEMFDAVASQDYANCDAVADVVVDGSVILPKVPVTYLLFLEKQTKDIETFISKLPTLDPSEQWSFNAAAGHYATPPAETARTKKVPKAFVKYAATKEHPAQVETFHEDVLAGYWKTIKFSGAIPASEKTAMLEKVRRLREGVVTAREEANSIEAKHVTVGKLVFDFLFR